jgi:hypothetical protein
MTENVMASLGSLDFTDYRQTVLTLLLLKRFDYLIMWLGGNIY